MFKNSPISAAGRWLITLVYSVCAVMSVALILVTLPDVALALRGVLVAVALLWLVPLFLCTLLGHHWSRHLTSVLALSSIPILLVHWSDTRAAVALGLMGAGIGAWGVLTFVRSVRSPVPW